MSAQPPLGAVLAWHRALCGDCGPGRACGEYLDIVSEYTEPRRIYVGATAPYMRLSVREAV